MFINFTNHASRLWGKKQRKAAEVYGDIFDIPFPAVSPAAPEEDIERTADEYAGRIITLKPDCVLCQGEFNLCYAVTKRLLEKGIKTVAACSERKSVEKDGKKVSIFEFTGFRDYR